MTLAETIATLATPDNRAAYAVAQDKAALVQDILAQADIPAQIDGPRCRYLEDLLNGD